MSLCVNINILLLLTIIISRYSATEQDYLKNSRELNLCKSKVTNVEYIWSTANQQCQELPTSLFIDKEQAKVKCKSSDIDRTLKDSKTIICKPTHTIVDINECYDGFVKPPQIRTKKCIGWCNYSSERCTSVSSKNVSVAVTVLKHGKAPECRFITVQKDTKCKCTTCWCKKSPAECNKETQVFDKKSCKCKCRNEEEHEICARKGGFDWDMESCTCRCSQSDCTTGTVWNQLQCKCL